jgi:hypothetical protein
MRGYMRPGASRQRQRFVAGVLPMAAARRSTERKRMSHIVVEEIWSTSSAANERRLLRSSARPLFAGLRQAAYEYAKQRANEYDSHRFNEDAERSYWWGRNAGDRATHRFVIEPAPA